MVLGLALALMTVTAMASVVLPLVVRARAQPQRGAFDRAVYRDQLKELERDIARGLIDEQEAASARLEIERRLLAADDRNERVVETAGSPTLAVALALCVPMAAAIVYLAIGSPGAADQPLAGRAAERSAADSPPGHEAFAASAAKLERQLEQNPADAEKWLLLARTEAELGRWQKSVDAYRRVMALTNNRSDFASSYGEMLVMAADGIVTPAAQQQFAAALADDPDDVPARFYTALAEAQAGDAAAAIGRWQRLAADIPEETIRAELRRRIEEAARAAGIPVPALAPAKTVAAAPGPTAEDMANAGQMSGTEQQTMIRSMVERLATRLQSTPDDVEGWLRLGRAYGVLGERDKAVAAYEHAQRLLPADNDQQQAVAAAIAALKGK
jgi:cytochrome c-type biogenesis protein CcmH